MDRRLINTTNQSNYDLGNSRIEEHLIMHKSSTNDDLANPKNFDQIEENDEYACDNYYWLPVEERNFLWNAAREHKLATIRKITSNSGLEECTFQPKLISNRYSRRNPRDKENEHFQALTSVSIQKYVARMNKVRDTKRKEKEVFDKKPGSGKLWKRKVTIPHEPRFGVSSSTRARSNRRSCLSLTKIMSANNLSIQNIDLYNNYDEYSQVTQIMIYVLTLKYSLS